MERKPTVTLAELPLGSWFHHGMHAWQKLTDDGRGSWCQKFSQDGTAILEQNLSPVTYWYSNNLEVIPAQAVIRPAAACGSQEVPDGPLPAELSPLYLLGQIARKHPLHRFVPHDERNCCRTSYPYFWQVWCDQCLARQALENAGTLLRDWQADVYDFMKACGQHLQETPNADVPLAVRDLRRDLIHEEACEVAEALNDGDLAGIADGLADLIYVVLGAACTYGIDLRPVWAAVHAANMAKTQGPKREDGKQLKPDGWTPPKLLPILGVQGALSRVLKGEPTETTPEVS